jgi:hypothetical protein
MARKRRKLNQKSKAEESGRFFIKKLRKKFLTVGALGTAAARLPLRRPYTAVPVAEYPSVMAAKAAIHALLCGASHWRDTLRCSALQAMPVKR